jgi:hypothetical protein
VPGYFLEESNLYVLHPAKLLPKLITSVTNSVLQKLKEMRKQWSLSSSDQTARFGPRVKEVSW